MMLTSTETAVLRQIHGAPSGEIRLSALSATGSNHVAALGVLVRRGLVHRPRGRRYALTAAGSAALDDMSGNHVGGVMDALDQMSAIDTFALLANMGSGKGFVLRELFAALRAKYDLTDSRLYADLDWARDYADTSRAGIANQRRCHQRRL